jgi:hypothetical protein
MEAARRDRRGRLRRPHVRTDMAEEYIVRKHKKLHCQHPCSELFLDAVLFVT